MLTKVYRSSDLWVEAKKGITADAENQGIMNALIRLTNHAIEMPSGFDFNFHYMSAEKLQEKQR